MRRQLQRVGAWLKDVLFGEKQIYFFGTDISEAMIVDGYGAVVLRPVARSVARKLLYVNFDKYYEVDRGIELVAAWYPPGKSGFPYRYYRGMTMGEAKARIRELCAQFEPYAKAELLEVTQIPLRGAVSHG